MEAVLGDGQITSAHVDAMVVAAKETPAVLEHQEDLARTAASMGPDDFAQVCKRMAFLLADDGGVGTLQRQRQQSRVKRRVDQVTGMYRLTAE